MFRNYFTIAWRNIIKNKLHGGINILGLSVAFICSILLLVNVNYEFSFDNFHANKDRLFKVYNYVNGPEGEEHSTSMSYPARTLMKNEVPAVEYTSRYMNGGNGVSYNSNEYQLSVNLVDEDFFKMFSFPIEKGMNNNPLADLGNVVISKNAAKVIFNNVDPIGKTLKVKVNNKWKDFVISAVISDAPKNSTLQFEVLVRTENRDDYAEGKDSWGFQHHNVYVKLKDNFTQAQTEKQIFNAMQKYVARDVADLKRQGAKPNAKGEIYTMRLLSFNDMHFDTELGGGNTVSKTYLITLIIISFFVLAIACFNFINLNVARAFTRAREVGVRKCLGAGTKQIFLQLWGESILLCAVSLVIGITGVILLIPYFNELFAGKIELDFLYQPAIVVAILFGVLMVSLIAGGYPALLMVKLSTVNILKGKVSIKKPGLFRNALIVVQFSIACLLICCTLVIYYQFEHLRNAPLGFAKENIISIPIYKYENSRTYLSKMRIQLAKEPSIVSLSGSSVNIGIGKDNSQSKWSTGFEYNGKAIMSTIIGVDFDYFKTLGIKIAEGRDFSPSYSGDTSNNVIVTQSMAKQFQEKSNVGITYHSGDSTKPATTIVGVVPDVRMYSMYEEAEPLSFFISESMPLSYLYVKTNSTNPRQAMELVEKTFKRVAPEETFQGTFMDENVGRWYEKEKKLANLFFIAAGIAITLSCLGLFAIALLIIEQRTKEIGIRKVLGATVFGITSLLSKEFLKLVFIAVCLAIPTAWYIMNNWLQDFTYRITLNWWLFAFAGCASVIIAILTVSIHSIKAALSSPIKSIRTE